MTKLEAEIIVALADNDMHIIHASQQLNCHRNTLLRHLTDIKESTGADPRCFRELCFLLPMAEAVLKEEEQVWCGQCRFWLEDFGKVCAREEDWIYTSATDSCALGKRRLQ